MNPTPARLTRSQRTVLAGLVATGLFTIASTVCAETVTSIDLVGATTESYPIIAHGTKAVFPTNEASNALFLWATDGTAVGTKKIATLSSPSSVGRPQVLSTAKIASGVLIVAQDFANTRESLWLSDGTESGTKVLVPDLRGGNTWSTNWAGMGAGTKALFVRRNAGAQTFAVITSDGTTAGTQTRSEVAGLGDLVGTPSRVYFKGTDGDIRMFDGASITKPAIAADRAQNALPGMRGSCGESLFFTYGTTASVRRLMRYDGSGSAIEVTDGDSANAMRGRVVCGAASTFFFTWTSDTGAEPWVYVAGQPAHLQADIFDGVGSSIGQNPPPSATLGDRLIAPGTYQTLQGDFETRVFISNASGNTGATKLANDDASEFRVLGVVGARLYYRLGGHNSPATVFGTDGASVDPVVLGSTGTPDVSAVIGTKIVAGRLTPPGGTNGLWVLETSNQPSSSSSSGGSTSSSSGGSTSSSSGGSTSPEGDPTDNPASTADPVEAAPTTTSTTSGCSTVADRPSWSAMLVWLGLGGIVTWCVRRRDAFPRSRAR